MNDGGGKVLAALNPIFGADRVARFLVGIASKTSITARIQFVLVNGQPGALCFADGDIIFAVTGDMSQSGIDALYMVRNPDKLARINVPST